MSHFTLVCEVEGMRVMGQKEHDFHQFSYLLYSQCFGGFGFCVVLIVLGNRKDLWWVVSDKGM